MSRFAPILMLLALPVVVLAQEPEPAASEAPLTEAERAGFAAAVAACWLADPEAPAVTVRFDLTPEGRVVEGLVTLTDPAEQAGEEVAEAFQAARRAVLRCQGEGYPLPARVDAGWRGVLMTFDPAGITLP